MDFTDAQLALMVLQEAGNSREAAALALVNDPGMTGRLASKIADKRLELERGTEAVRQRAIAETPAGRAKAAAEALAARAERAELVEGARELLANEGTPTDGLPDEAILHHAGIERQVALMSQDERDAEATRVVEREWGTLEKFDRSAKLHALGVSEDAARAHRSAMGLPVDAEGGDGE